MGRADVHQGPSNRTERGIHIFPTLDRKVRDAGSNNSGVRSHHLPSAGAPHDTQVWHMYFGTYNRSRGTLIRPHMDTQNKTELLRITTVHLRGRLRAGPVSESESHESTSLSRLLRQEGLAPQMCVGRVNCDARGMQRGTHPAGEMEGIPRLFHWTVISNCHARGCKCGPVGHCCGAAEASRAWVSEKASTRGPTRAHYTQLW